MCINIFPCMFVPHNWTEKIREWVSVRCLETRVTDGVKSPCECWEPNSCSLEEKPLLLTAEPSPQPSGLYFNATFCTPTITIIINFDVGTEQRSEFQSLSDCVSFTPVSLLSTVCYLKLVGLCLWFNLSCTCCSAFVFHDFDSLRRAHQWFCMRFPCQCWQRDVFLLVNLWHWSSERTTSEVI